VLLRKFSSTIDAFATGLSTIGMPIPCKDPPDALCMIRLSAIGDTCHAVPAVRAIQDAWPDTAITWIIGKIEHSLLAGLEGVEFVVLDKRKGLAGYRDVRRALRGRRFPILLHMHASLRANIVSTLVRADIRLGFDRSRARDHQAWFCNAHLPATPRQHVMDGLLEFVQAIGIEPGAPRWDIPLSPDDTAFAAKHVDASRPTLLISPCTGQRFRNFRNWRVERYAAVADYAARQYGAAVVLTGAASQIEQRYAREIVALAESPVRNLIGQTTLKQLLAMIARSTAMLCPDSGPAHMSTAVGTPVIGLYATSNRHRTGPYSSQHLVVDKYPAAVAKEFGKPVEALRWGERVRNPDAMDLIEVDEVKRKIDSVFTDATVARKARPLAT